MVDIVATTPMLVVFAPSRAASGAGIVLRPHDGVLEIGLRAVPP